MATGKKMKRGKGKRKKEENCIKNRGKSFKNASLWVIHSKKIARDLPTPLTPPAAT